MLSSVGPVLYATVPNPKLVAAASSNTVKFANVPAVLTGTSFNPVTVIRFELPVAGRVSLSVFDLLGQKIAGLVHEEMQAGYHQAEWNAQAMPSGLYFYRLEVTALEQHPMKFFETRKMLLIR